MFPEQPFRNGVQIQLEKRSWIRLGCVETGDLFERVNGLRTMRIVQLERAGIKQVFESILTLEYDVQLRWPGILLRNATPTFLL